MKSKAPQTLAAEYADRRRCETEYKAGLWRTDREIYSGTFVTHWMRLPVPPEVK